VDSYKISAPLSYVKNPSPYCPNPFKKTQQNCMSRWTAVQQPILELQGRQTLSGWWLHLQRYSFVKTKQSRSRVAQGNFTPRPSQIRTWTSPLIRLLSSHRSSQRPCLTSWLLPLLVDQTVRPDDPIPSLHLHYRDFNTTTSWSAPVLRIGTLTLVGPPIWVSPLSSERQVPTFHARTWFRFALPLCRTPPKQ
jgi:hypothetical protein